MKTCRLLLSPRFAAGLCAAGTLLAAVESSAQTVTIDTSQAARRQTIDGFGTCLSGDEGAESWFQNLYYDDLGSSILRIDLTPPFTSPYSDLHYNSPWFGQDPSIDNGGPEGNYVRTYTSAADYTRNFGGHTAQIAVMGPNIDENVKLLDFAAVKTAGVMAQVGTSRSASLGGFKLYGSMWSPAPWLKISSGNSYPGSAYPLPAANTPWPFIWGGNYAGGRLDTSDTPLPQFDDSSVGGTGPTSALTQFARNLAAYLRGFQTTYGVQFYAISIQNEVNFEEFYNSCSYPLSSQYIQALKAARAELDKYDDLKGILIAGPEDLMGGDGWGMWQYGGGSDTTHKNLQYLSNIAADPAAAAALAFFNIHGYAPDGVSAAGADPKQWRWWAEGWTTAPAQGLPDIAAGFRSYGKKSWMTETSGEETAWLAPAGQFPSGGGFSIAMKIHQALTVGRESAWIYWQTSDGKPMAAETLTDATAQANAAKLAAARHFFKFIRPGAVAVDTAVSGSTDLLASAYLHETNGTLSVVLINTSAAAVNASVAIPAMPAGIQQLTASTSSDGAYGQSSSIAVTAGTAAVTVPGYGVVSLVGSGTPLPADAGPDGNPSVDAGADGSAKPDGAGGSAGGGVAGSGGNTDGGLPGQNAGAPSDDGGCGCRTQGLSSGQGAWFWLLAWMGMGVLARRRRSNTELDRGSCVSPQ